MTLDDRAAAHGTGPDTTTPTLEPAPGQEEAALATPSLARRTVRVFTTNKLALAGLLVLLLLLAFCYIGPLLHPTDQRHTNLDQANLPPGNGGHLLGSTDLGYDLLGRLMVAGQTSLEVGLAAGLLATVIGTIWGAVSGYFGGWVDAVMMRVTDAAMAIPAMFLLVVVSAIITPSKLVLIGIISCVAWLSPARLIRGESLSLRNREYVQAMRMMGGGGARAVFRHIVPNAIGTVIVNCTFQIADAILYVSYLAFLGLSIPPPAADWGSMLSSGITYTQNGYWWLIFPPGIAIVLVVGAFNFIGDGLRDAFEVRLRSG